MKNKETKKAEVNSALHHYLKIRKSFKCCDNAYRPNYFSWIANFGVVPLLRQHFLRLAPCLERFALRLFSVTLVLETISCPWLKWIMNMRGILPISRISVKKRGVLGRPYALLLAFLTLLRPIAWAESIILAPGEHWEQNFPHIQRYSIGNHEIVSHRFEEKNKQLILKGLKIGHTELVVWNQRKAKESFQIFVISKQKELSLLQTAQGLKKLGLQVEVNHNLLQISGTLQTIPQYQQYLKIIAQTSLPLVTQANLAIPLRNQIIARIYQPVMDNFFDEVACHSHNLQITCSYAVGHPLPAALQEELRKAWGVVWLAREDNPQVNYRLKLKILQLENSDGQDIDLGIHQLNAPLNDYFTKSLAQIVSSNATLLASQQIEFSHLASPEILLRPEHPAKIKVGLEVPYERQKKFGVEIVWKFVGLELDFTLHLNGDLCRLDYTVHYSSPAEGSKNLQDNSQASSVTTRFGQALELFDVVVEGTTKQHDALPGLGKIPLLKHLASSQHHNTHKKKIMALAQLERQAVLLPEIAPEESKAQAKN